MYTFPSRKIRMYVRRLPTTKIAILVVGIFFTAAATTFVFAKQSDPPSQKAIAKNTNPSATPKKKPSPTIAHSASSASNAAGAGPTATPTPTKPLPSITPKNTETSIGGTTSQTAQTSPTSLITQALPTAAPTSIPTPTAGGSLLDQVNSYRASQGLGPVQSSSETCAFAATRAQEITSNFSHDGFNSRVSSNTLPYSSWSGVTENIAQTSNPQNVVPMWINSPGHAANMRADTPYVCIRQNGDYYAYEGMKP